MEEKKHWYAVNNIDEVDSPVLLIYPERVKRNIQTAVDMIGDVSRLRPHVKTNKSPDAIKLMIAAGIQKFKSATIAESELLGVCGASDVLLAYQLVGPKLSRFVELIRRFPKTVYSCLVDNGSAALQMASIFSAAGITVPVYVDVNLGQNRTGIEPGDALIELYFTCSRMHGIMPVGLHAYDGHIRDQDWNLRKQHCDSAYANLEKMKSALVSRGLPSPRIIAGGSPTFSIHCKRKEIDCSPGTFIYWDKGYLDLCPEQDFLPAVLVATRVISLPEATKICLDLGHKSIAAENDLSKRVYFLDQPPLKAWGQSEEHLVMEAGTNHGYQIGDLLYGMPYHICPTVALYERAITVENGMASGEWKTVARDRKISI